MTKKTDLRVLKTRENIKTSFINLLLIKNFKDITIQNIIDEALIGRSTFYDHYIDKYDLLEHLVNEILTDFKSFIKDRFNINSREDLINFSSTLFNYYSQKRTIFLALLKVHTESVDLYDSLTYILKEGFSSYWDNMNIKTEYNIPKEYFCRVYAAVAMSSLQFYVENKDEYTQEHFLEAFNGLKKLVFEIL
jgi:AcrR family transcriptional regulator